MASPEGRISSPSEDFFHPRRSNLSSQRSYFPSPIPDFSVTEGRTFTPEGWFPHPLGTRKWNETVARQWRPLRVASPEGDFHRRVLIFPSPRSYFSSQRGDFPSPMCHSLVAEGWTFTPKGWFPHPSDTRKQGKNVAQSGGWRPWRPLRVNIHPRVMISPSPRSIFASQRSDFSIPELHFLMPRRGFAPPRDGFRIPPAPGNGAKTSRKVGVGARGVP